MCMRNEENNHNLTHLGVTVSILYFGLLRCCDATKLEVDDVTIEESGRVVINFEHARKQVNHGFKFYVPAVYENLFKKYLSQLKKEKNGKTRFLKNWNMKSKTRVQNTGRDKVGKAINEFCKLLGISDEGYTSHGFRRSAATNLADTGVTLVNLKRHGQWSADSSAERYLENSKPIREERECLLMPQKNQKTRTVMSSQVLICVLGLL